jgi:two-component system chemotaxis response regulator CheB
MPLNVMQQIDVDHVVPIVEMANLVSKQYAAESCNIDGIPADVKLEADITIRMSSKVSELQQLAEPTVFTCPDCGGTLMKIKGERQNRYRCYTGHSFSEKALENTQLNELENSLWVAIRMMEERRNLLNNMQAYQHEAKLERSNEMEIHIKRLKGMLQNLGDGNADLPD